MTKTVNIESVIKSIYTKDEIRYAKAQGWTLVSNRKFTKGDTLDVDLKYRNGEVYAHAGHVISGWYTYETTDWPLTKKAECIKAVEKRAKAVRKQMAENFAKSYNVNSLEEWCKAEDERIAAEKKAKREEESIEAMLKADGLCGITSAILKLRTGEHTGKFTACYADKNGIVVDEDFERYSGRCKYWKITRSFTLKIRKGWHLYCIGGLLTFIKGNKINRQGMACEWIEQGKQITDVKTVSGFLVRGEHIEAKTLKQAQAINEEHRAMQLARVLNERKRVERRAEQKANGTLRITFQDSLKAGNCRPGTSEFKHKYEEAIGHEAKDISIADLRKYGKLFGVEYYAERAIQYALRH